MIFKNSFAVIIALLYSTHVFAIQAPFSAVESTISQLHLALQSKSINCQAITQAFINRIKVYDKRTKLNSIILINKNALNKAKQLDKEYTKTGQLRTLHCVPVILKDNFDTADMPTEAGSIALKNSIPSNDAFVVRKLREAGAIIIAKSNMSEWALSSYNTISSTHGETLNAYNIEHVPAGSSGGSASAIAASFGIIGMGTDTGNSVRGPASHLALVGLRPSFGLLSHTGIVPLLANRDIAGVLTRTVMDAAKTLSVISLFDSTDKSTDNFHTKQVINYAEDLKSASLKGVRLAVMRPLFDNELAGFDIIDLMEQAIDDLKSAGAIIVDPFEINNFKKLSQATGFCSRFKYDLNQYLKTLDSSNTNIIHTFKDMYNKNVYLEQNKSDLAWAAAINVKPEQQKPPCIDVNGDHRRKNLLDAVVNAMDKYNINAIIYPSWSNPARKTNDTSSPQGNNSSVIAPHTGQPAITVPMGFTQEGLPAGLQFLARPFDDKNLLRYAYAYEQISLKRKPPLLFPAIK